MSSGTAARTRASAVPVPPAPRRIWPLALLAAAVGALVATGVLLLVRDGDEPTSAAPRQAEAAPPAGQVVGEPIRVGHPGGWHQGSKYLWVVNEAAGTVNVIDPVSERLAVPPIRVGGRPNDLELGAASIFVASSDSDVVSRIDPRTFKVSTRIPVGDKPSDLAMGPGAVWVANEDDDTVERIDTLTNLTVGRPIPVGEAPSSLIYADGSVWVTNTQDDTVSRIDPRSRRVVKTIHVGDHPIGLTVGLDAVWVTNLEGDSVSRIDFDSNRVVRTIHVGDRPMRPKAGANYVWVPNSGDGTLSRIDLRTNRVVGRPIPIGRSADRVGIAFDGIWVTSSVDNTLTRIEPTD
jgi:YVTN family beta-propeller protein